MKAILEITMDNAAFTESGNGREVARILEKLATRIREDHFTDTENFGLFDANGNRVGNFTVTV